MVVCPSQQVCKLYIGYTHMMHVDLSNFSSNQFHFNRLEMTEKQSKIRVTGEQFTNIEQ